MMKGGADIEVILEDRVKVCGTMKWHSNSGHLEKDDIEINKFEVSYDNTKEELFEAV